MNKFEPIRSLLPMARALGVLLALTATTNLFAAGKAAPKTLQCQGSGSARILLVGGTGALPMHFDELRKMLGVLAEVCLYDRGRTGLAIDAPSHLEAGVEELRRVALHLGASKPLILAGHSYGGWLVQVAAQRHAKELGVAGILLLDSLHGDQWKQLPAGISKAVTAAILKTRQAADMARSDGLPQTIIPPPPDGNEASRQTYFQRMKDPATYDSMATEMQASLQLDPRLPLLPDLPLVVVSALDSFAAFPGLDAPLHIEANLKWQALQTELASRPGLVAHLISLTGDHRIHRTDPELIVRGTSMLLAAIHDPQWAAHRPQAVDSLMSMWNLYARAYQDHDIPGMLRHFGPDVILIRDHGPLLRGRTEGREYIETLHGTDEAGFTLQTRELILSGAFAYRLGNHHADFSPRTGGKEIVAEGTFLQFYRYSGSVWEIVTETVNSQLPQNDVLPESRGR